MSVRRTGSGKGSRRPPARDFWPHHIFPLLTMRLWPTVRLFGPELSRLPAGLFMGLARWLAAPPACVDTCARGGNQLTLQAREKEPDGTVECECCWVMVSRDSSQFLLRMRGSQTFLSSCPW